MKVSRYEQIERVAWKLNGLATLFRAQSNGDYQNITYILEDLSSELNSILEDDIEKV